MFKADTVLIEFNVSVARPPALEYCSKALFVASVTEVTRSHPQNPIPGREERRTS
jgi:hypothetical protein